MRPDQADLDCVNGVDPHACQKTALYIAGILIADLDGDLERASAAIEMCGRLLPVILAKVTPEH